MSKCEKYKYINLLLDKICTNKYRDVLIRINI